jgi:ABC-type transporter Mla subunit MlaD
VSEGGKRALMQVDPTRLVELAASSEGILDEMAQDWQAAVDDLAMACAGLGDAAGTLNVAASYADSLADAGEVVTALAQALGVGIAGLVDAAQDAVRADDTVAGELARATHQLEGDGFGTLPGRGGR